MAKKDEDRAVRTTVSMPPHTAATLKGLAARMNTSSDSESFRRMIDIVGELLKYQEEGAKLQLLFPDGRTETLLFIGLSVKPNENST